MGMVFHCGGVMAVGAEWRLLARATFALVLVVPVSGCQLTCARHVLVTSILEMRVGL